MQTRIEDDFKLLGLSKEATAEEVKKAYRKIALKWHPDKNPGNEKHAEDEFRKIMAAKERIEDFFKIQFDAKFSGKEPASFSPSDIKVPKPVNTSKDDILKFLRTTPPPGMKLDDYIKFCTNDLRESGCISSMFGDFHFTPELRTGMKSTFYAYYPFLGDTLDYDMFDIVKNIGDAKARYFHIYSEEDKALEILYQGLTQMMTYNGGFDSYLRTLQDQRILPSGILYRFECNPELVIKCITAGESVFIIPLFKEAIMLKGTQIDPILKAKIYLMFKAKWPGYLLPKEQFLDDELLKFKEEIFPLALDNFEFFNRIRALVDEIKLMGYQEPTYIQKKIPQEIIDRELNKLDPSTVSALEEFYYQGNSVLELVLAQDKRLAGGATTNIVDLIMAIDALINKLFAAQKLSAQSMRHFSSTPNSKVKNSATAIQHDLEQLASLKHDLKTLLTNTQSLEILEKKMLEEYQGKFKTTIAQRFIEDAIGIKVISYEGKTNPKKPDEKCLMM